MAKPYLLSATDVRDLFRNNTITVEEYARALLGRIEERDSIVKAWAFLDPAFVLSQARALDEIPSDQRGPLHGLAIGIKDVMNTKDMPTQFGSPIYKGHRSGFDSSAVAILRDAGALIFGKTTTTEFTVTNSGPLTTNPHDPNRTPGGSSCGSAAAVADFQVPLSLGAQTGGSVIRPASFTGVFAMKPTHNTILLEGQKTYAPTFDSFGFFARSVDDLQLLADVFGLGDDEPPKEVPLADFSVAMVNTPMWQQAGPGMVAAMHQAAATLRNKGAKVVEVCLGPEVGDINTLKRIQKVIISSEAQASFLREYRVDKANLAAEICELVENTANYTNKERFEASDAYARMRCIVNQLIAKYCVVVTPSAVDEAPLGLHDMGSATFNTMWTGFHVPVINIPAFTGVHGMPIGLSLVVPRYRDQHLLRVSKIVSDALMTKMQEALHHRLGVNPLPTFDWNYVVAIVDPLYMPAFTTFNVVGGAFASMFVVIGIYRSNAYNSAFIPINSNLPWDRFGKRYNVTRVLDDRGFLDVNKYNDCSKPYRSAGNITIYTFFFAVYIAAITHAILSHRHEIMMGFRGAFRNIFKSNKASREDAGRSDVHMRHMSKYKEVPEWWYLIILVIATAIGMMSMAYWPTGTSPAVVIYGMIMCAVFVIPIDIIYAMTGTQVTLNVLAEFIGGCFVKGNAVGMCFFKTYGYLTCAQALNLAQDLKLGHYVKIPPRIMFWAQMVPTLVSTFVFVGLLHYQIHIDKICTADAPFKFICPHENTFFTAAVTWGTVGPSRQFGTGSPYATTLIGFPLGIIIVLAFHGLGKWFPKTAFLRNIHPVILITGALYWAPYSMSFIWPAAPVAFVSWIYIRKRYLAFWSKYNYVLSAAFSAGMAISGIIQFFGLGVADVGIDWWGNNVVGQGCEAKGCPRFKLAKGESFAPRPGA